MHIKTFDTKTKGQIIKTTLLLQQRRHIVHRPTPLLLVLPVLLTFSSSSESIPGSSSLEPNSTGFDDV